jgi:hypothetical protein
MATKLNEVFGIAGAGDTRWTCSTSCCATRAALRSVLATS